MAAFGADVNLDQCAASLREIHAYWASLPRDGRVAPDRHALMPEDIPHHLPGMSIVEVQRNPMRFVYRLVGTRECRIRGYDPTGLSVEEGFIGRDSDYVLSIYRHVAETAEIAHDLEPSWSQDGQWMRGEVIYLPFTVDVPDRVDQIMTYAHFASAVEGHGVL